MKVIGWKAWYTDGSVYDSKQTIWQDLPDDGAVSVVLYFDEVDHSGKPIRRTLEGSDYYFMAPGLNDNIYGESFAQVRYDVVKDIARRHPGASIKRGKWTDDETMRRISKEAQEANEWFQ